MELEALLRKISAFIDEQIKPLVPKIQSYVKDKSYFLSLIMGYRLHDEDLIVTVDVDTLYTNIPCNKAFIPSIKT